LCWQSAKEIYRKRALVLKAKEGELLIMCILGKDKLIELIEKYKAIYPYDFHLL
jgi:hypothetical protein